MQRDRLTADLFEWQPPKVVAGFEPGELAGDRLGSKISRALALALKSCGMSRADVAQAMTTKLGSPISEAMLDAYASEAKEGHRITVERFIALIEVTGCNDLLGLVAEQFDMVVVPARYAALIELHLLDEHEQEVTRRKQAVQARWRAGR